MRSLLLHERHKVWKREFGYDRLETAAEMDEKRSRISTSAVTNPFFYRSMVIPNHPHTPEEFSLQMKVDVEGLRMEIILSHPRRQSAIHRRDAPRSLRGQRNPERRRSRLRLVRGQDPREKFSLLKPVGMCFCVQNAQARRRSIFCCKFNQTEWTTATTQPHHKTPLARSLRDYFLASSKGWQRGQPTKANSSIREDFCDKKFLSSEEIFCLYCLCFVSFCLYFYLLPYLSYFVFFPLCRRSRYERRNEPLFGCTGCVMLHQGAFTISIFRQ